MTDTRSVRVGGIAGIVYVLVALVAAALPGAPPEADGRAVTYQNYFVAHEHALVTQAWMYAFAAPLMLIFAISVHRVLRKSDDDGYLAGIFLFGTAAVATLLLVTQAIQIAVAQHADAIPADVVFTVGVHFPGVLIGLWGFFMAATAFAYAYCVFAHGVLPRWTGGLAALAFMVSLTATAGVFFRTGAFCLEGGFSAWAPAATTVLWYLGTSIAIVRIRDGAPAVAKSPVSVAD
ncbi:DUF4386 family protein [Mycobacterium conspicuum]|uniref:DUF4386 family protein n=1 Tax=Mycobacterium conspicuum TaxID=44010 RepID=UPI00111C3B47|nr:DUF4386 family protein [Mycobacterium conspicuum]